MNKVYVVISDWCESTDLFGVYSSFESAKKAILNWAGGNGKWISGDCFETNVALIMLQAKIQKQKSPRWSII